MKTHKQIFEYWKGKAITKDGKIVIHDYDGENLISVVGTWCEPMCWACGMPITGDYEDKEVKSILNRCHIKAKQFGGEDIEDNLFLMCEECHQESPDTLNRDAFMRWVFKKRKNTFMGKLHPREYIRLINEELASRNLPDIVTMHYICHNMQHDGFNEFMQENLGTHGGKVAISSEIIAMTDFYEMKFKEALSKYKEVA